MKVLTVEQVLECALRRGFDIQPVVDAVAALAVQIARHDRIALVEVSHQDPAFAGLCASFIAHSPTSIRAEDITRMDIGGEWDS